MKILDAKIEDGNSLAELRVVSMRESLEAIGRFDPIRARDRFLSKYNANLTQKVIINGKIAAFYMVSEFDDHLYLDDLYVHPDFQRKGIGSKIMGLVIDQSHVKGKPIKLGALKESLSNEFYLSHGFVKSHSEQYDNYYVRT